MTRFKETHGLSRHTLYSAWKHMIQRCHNENNDAYEYYGARGITVCDEWRNDFKAFFDHVITLPNYGLPGYTIDRGNNDLGYKPGNVVWADKHTQAVNRGMFKNNKSGYIGVYKSELLKNYLSRIRVNNKSIHIGSYPTVELAVDARNQYIIDNKLTGYKLQKYDE